MSYGNKGWRDWVIDEQQEVNGHVKFAYVPARSVHLRSFPPPLQLRPWHQCLRHGGCELYRCHTVARKG